MRNFFYKNPTEIIFGKGTIAEIRTRIPKNRHILFLYGQGSIKKNGVYEQVKAALRGRKVTEFGGIEANPLFETCMKAVAVVRQKKIGFILAVGGGSVLDASKFIAAASCFKEKNFWSILQKHGDNVTAALPIGTVLTLPATGSESNGNSVISRESAQEKLHFYSPHVFPLFSVLDPETTYSLPGKQIRNGIVDAFVHVMEQYLTYPDQALLQDRMAESLLQTLIDIAPETLQVPKNYQARASFMWSATLALNTLIGCGVPQDWSTHMIAHELTAFYGLDHAETLAIILPGVWRYKFSEKKEKLKQYGFRVWNVHSAEAAIEKTETFFHSLNMPTRLSDYKIAAADAAENVWKRFKKRGVAFGEHGDIDAKAAAEIIRSRT